MMVSNNFLNEGKNHKYFIVVESLCQVLPDLLFELFIFCFFLWDMIWSECVERMTFWDVDISHAIWNILHVSLIILCPFFFSP